MNEKRAQGAGATEKAAIEAPRSTFTSSLGPSRKDLFRNFGLPAQLVLAVNFCSNGELFIPIKKAGSNDDLGTRDGLMVVDVRCAIWAIIAVDGFAYGQEPW